jgi:hypothetical protein
MSRPLKPVRFSDWTFDVSLDEHLTPGQENFQAPAAPRSTSGLAIAGLIFAFLIAPVGLILSLIAIFKTGPAPRKKGRGLAIAGLIISLLAIGGGVAAVFAVTSSTVADAGCIDGKKAILDGSEKIDAASLQKTVDGLNAAAAKSKHADVSAAMTALSGDYTQLINAMKTGKVPAGLEDKITTDAKKIDSLCSIGA